jgi:hypothetical protein
VEDGIEGMRENLEALDQLWAWRAEPSIAVRDEDLAILDCRE